MLKTFQLKNSKKYTLFPIKKDDDGINYKDKGTIQ